MLHLSNVLQPRELATVNGLLDDAAFVDGAVSGGEYGKRVKNNQQVKPTEEVRARVIPVLQQALYRHPEFVSYARPRRMVLNINRYEVGMSYGNHNDAALTGSFPDHVVRTDLSMTLFLTPPDAYDGGELVMVSPYGEVPVKLPAGDAILYPSNMLHRVEPITRGVRVGAFSWIQSMIRDEQQRLMIHRLDQLRREMVRDQARAGYIETVGNTYNNLLRMWVED